MIRVFLHLVLLGAITAVIAPAETLAQPAAAVDKKQVAKQYVDAGLAAQKSRDYDTAITFYQKAYQLVPHPVLIFNIAQAHRLAGRVDEALALYRKYLSEDPNGAQAKTARDLIVEIEARKAEAVRKAEEARKAEADREAAEARKAEAARKAAEARKIEEARSAEDTRKAEARRIEDASKAGEQLPSVAPGATSPVDTGPQSPPEVSPGRTSRIAGIAIGAGGAAALVIGAGYGLHARSLSSELSQPGAEYTKAKEDAGKRADTIAIVGLTGGAVLVAAGAALYYWGHLQDQSVEKLSLAPMVSSQVAGVALIGAWP